MSAVISATIPPASAYSQLFGSPSIDARLNLSLDDLIKERRKETKKDVKQKKRENVKQELASPTKMAAAHEQKKKATANVQTEKRQEKMNKNRGLTPDHPKKKQADKENSNKSNAIGKKNKKQQQPKRSKQYTSTVPVSRKLSSPKPNKQQKQHKQQNQQQHKNQNGQGKAAKKNGNNHKQQLNHKTPTLSPKQQPKKAMTFVVKATKNGREISKSTKGKNIQITLVRSKTQVRRNKQQMHAVSAVQATKKKRNTKAARALLPGKSQPKTRKVLAQTIVKKAKTAGSRKQWTSQNGKFVVRKPVMVRKA